MNATQIAALKAATTRKDRIAALKSIRAAGIEVLVKLNATTRAIADEVARLLAIVAAAVKSAVKPTSTLVKVSLAYWLKTPVRSENMRAMRGAIALASKLEF